MVSSLKNLCRFPALIEILNHPYMKKEIFSLPINTKNYKERDDALQGVLYEFLKDFNQVVKSNIERQFVFLIGFEMWKWANYVLKYFDLSFKFSESFIQSSLFTSGGIINEEKAARELLKEQSFSIFLKYNIACQYFLDDIIPGLWKVLQKKPNFKKWLEEQDPESPMIMWFDYLLEINSITSVRIRRVRTFYFKKRVFLYGLREKNLAAIKYSYGPKGEFTKTKTDSKIVRKMVYRPFCQFVERIMRDNKYLHFDLDLDIGFILSPNFLADRNIIMYFLSLMNKREMKEFFLHFHGSVNFLRWVLLWPFQNQFMDFAHIIFENFGVKEYDMIVLQIISLIIHQYTCQFYDYRLLLRHFWIKTPDNLKEQIIRFEYGELNMGLIPMMFMVPNFTGDDFAHVNLIFKNASSIDRKKFLMSQGEGICYSLIVYHNNFRLTDLFLKSLNLDQEILQTFKKDFTFQYSYKSILRQSIKLFEELCKWVVGSDEIDDFKSEIFHRLTQSDKVEHFFLELEEEIPFSFLNKLLKWFLRTDANIEEWKQNIVYSPLIEYDNPYWFDQLLKFRGYSYERITDIKGELLSERFYEIARMSFNFQNVTEYLKGNVFILCSSNKEKFLEFTEHLRSFYKDSIENKICLMCLNNNFDNVYGGEEQLNCALHGTEGFISLKKIHTICSSFLKDTKRD